MKRRNLCTTGTNEGARQEINNTVPHPTASGNATNVEPRQATPEEQENAKKLKKSEGKVNFERLLEKSSSSEDQGTGSSSTETKDDSLEPVHFGTATIADEKLEEFKKLSEDQKPEFFRTLPYDVKITLFRMLPDDVKINLLRSLNTISLNEIKEDPRLTGILRYFSNQIRGGDIGHTVWGSKPVCWIGSGQKFSEFMDKLYESGFHLEDNFAQKKDIVGDVFLINKFNLLKIININKKIMEEKFSDGEECEPEELMERIMKEMATKAFFNDKETLGTVLGYGQNNSKLFAEGIEVPQEGKIEAFRDAVKGAFPPANFPIFTVWDGKESEELMSRYLSESIEINEIFLKDAIESNDTEQLGLALLNSILQRN